MYPTLAEVLELPVVRAAAPRVRAGGSGLDAPVRWVHVSEQRNPAGTLSGGELVLSSGIAVADPANDPAVYVSTLRDAGAAGLVVELGQHVRSLPAALVQAARAAGFPLIELGRAIRFVELTEILHAQIVNSQFARMESLQRVHDTFRALTVESGGVSRILTEAAALTGLPVVLEDLGHRALSFAGDPAATLLKDWSARSHQVPSTSPPVASGPEGWMTTPVGPRGRHWGRLVVPRRMVDDAAAEQVTAVLVHAADALTIGRLLGDDPLGLEREAQSELLQDLLHATSLDEPELQARARALGLPIGGPLTVLVLGGPPGQDQHVLDAAGPAARSLQAAVVTGRLAPGRVGLVAAQRARAGDPDLGARIASRLPPDVTVVAATTAPVTGFTQLAAALDEASFVVDVVTASGRAATRRVWRGSDLGVQGLLWQLRDDPRLHAFVDAQLEPLLRLDGRQRDQMLATLLAHLEADGRMTAFAAAIGLSRPAAYARLARLREVLGPDLGQPRTRLALHLALLALDHSRNG